MRENKWTQTHSLFWPFFSYTFGRRKKFPIFHAKLPSPPYKFLSSFSPIHFPTNSKSRKIKSKNILVWLLKAVCRRRQKAPPPTAAGENPKFRREYGVESTFLLLLFSPSLPLPCLCLLSLPIPLLYFCLPLFFLFSLLFIFF